ncbi:MAG: alpha/beta hydrolase fold domain-containing protein [Prevotella sp.]|nr:alpha/beta hydrolase fold domain-containing protein [Prevotella sp.]
MYINRRLRTLHLFMLLLGMSVARAQYQQVNDIPYSESTDAYAQQRCKLDIYYPTEASDAPVVVWFHGGGIEGGNKHIDQELRNSGLVVIAPNYRLLPKAAIDQCLDDAAAAVAWAYRNAEKYGGSHRKIFVAGHSAGGYLLDIIGLEKKWLAKYGVDADSLAGLIPFSGQCVTHYNIRKQQGIGPLQATIDQYAPLTHIRPDAPPMVIISGDRDLELYGRYEEQAYFWRMLKLVGHPDVTLYEMQGYDHGAMPHPAYHILKQQIRRITDKMTSPLPQPDIKTRQQAEYAFKWQQPYVRRNASIDKDNPAILQLGSDNGYYDLTDQTGALIQQLNDFSISVFFKVSSENQLDGYGHFLFAFSQLAENSAHEGPYMAMRLNEQRFETSTGGYEHEEIIMQGGKPKRDVWVHALYRQQGHKGELFLDGKLIGRNDNMPILSEIFSEKPACCWIGRAPFRGDKYLTQTQVADFRIYNYAISNQEMRQLKMNIK